jgi:hypothetical protein
MLIERLQSVVDHLAQFSSEQQERLAEEIEDIIDEALWDAQFADPRSEAFFDTLVAQAKRGQCVHSQHLPIWETKRLRMSTNSHDCLRPSPKYGILAAE